ncbi:hypothetical protein L6164_036348 [Bauhinia variegata]|uniref:Uncharacterized protein n=1 Tax=Bauhinia variegata TaxID=167791 RepID=A0ACB9KGT7_BAUVA|nr:hypothetical protein L6164_036348 [Bauhinia variegata]
MGSVGESKPHAVLLPYPAQGHIIPMTKLAKFLHFKGFHITFVNSEFNHKRFLKSKGPNTLDGLPDFCYETIPDGLPPSDADATQDIPSLCDSTSKTCLGPFLDLLAKLKDSASKGLVPPVTCIITDGVMTFSVKAAEIVGLPSVIFWTASACGFVGYSQYQNLVNKGLIPLKDESYLTNGYLDTVLDGIPGMKDIRLRDIPSFIRTTDPNDIMVNFFLRGMEEAHKASIIVINTFEEFERDALEALSRMFPPLYSIGPLHVLVNQIPESKLASIGSNLWKEDSFFLQWLDSREPKSVFYVNYGSITTMSAEQLVEFSWGLANTKKPFLWVLRPDLIKGVSVTLSPEFANETKDRGLIVSWCSQEQVLNHPAIGGFLTHCGWNSTIESVCAGVPMVCWPFFAEQQTNCRYACTEWGIGMEVDPIVKREEVEKLVNELMEGEKGKKKKQKAMEWKKKAEEAISTSGSSYKNLDTLINEVLLKWKNPC